jgi:adenosine kinase
MVFPGRFANDFLPGQSKGPLSGATMSMVVDSLDVRAGGVAANIAFGLGRLGHRPALVGAVGADFGEYRGWLERHGVDTTWLRTSATRSTARLLSTVDAENNRMVSLCVGALVEAHAIELATVAGGDLDLVMIAPGDARAMLTHAEECRRHGYRFAVDPAPQLGRLTTAELRALVTGADHVFTNATSADRLLTATGWSRAELLGHIGTWVVTLGADGVRLESAGTVPVQVNAAPSRNPIDKRGVAAAFRAGFLSGLGWHLSATRSAQVGSLLATLALETHGTQDYPVDPTTFVTRIEEAYGPTAAADVDGRLTAPHPTEDHCILGYN